MTDATTTTTDSTTTTDTTNGGREDYLLTPAELAALLNVKTGWVYDNVHQLPAIRINGRLLRFWKSEIDAWIEERRERWPH